MLAGLWTHGGKIGLRGVYTNFIKSPEKEEVWKSGVSG